MSGLLTNLVIVPPIKSTSPKTGSYNKAGQCEELLGKNQTSIPMKGRDGKEKLIFYSQKTGIVDKVVNPNNCNIEKTNRNYNNEGIYLPKDLGVVI